MKRDQRGGNLIASTAEETIPVQGEDVALVPPEDVSDPVELYSRAQSILEHKKFFPLNRRRRKTLEASSSARVWQLPPRR